MKRKICTLFALFCCVGVFSADAAGCSEEQNGGGGNEYVINNETNISGGNLSADMLCFMCSRKASPRQTQRDESF